MTTRTPLPSPERGSTLVVTISVVATILTLLGSAVAYTQHVSRVSDRSRKAAQALEVGDGHLEYLFTHWRAISRAPGFRLSYNQPPTNFFFTSEYNPGPAPTPWSPSIRPNPWPGTPAVIPKPSPSLFPDIPGYDVTQYRIQAVTPMVELTGTEDSTLATTAHPPYAYGANYWQYSVFYLASVDVEIPALNGTVSAKVRRIFEKKYDNPWTWAIFYNDDLEIHPDSTFVIDGPIHTNANLYIGRNTVTVQDSSNQVRPPSTVTFGGEYLNGFSPHDTSTRSSGVSAPTFPPKLPPAQESPYLPFGWNLKLTNEDGSVNNDSYRELIEPFESCGAETTDSLSEIRYFNQAAIRVLLVNTTLAQAASAGQNTITVRNVTGLAANMVIQVGASSTPERRVIQSVNCANKQITLTSNLSGSHSTGATVQLGEYSTLTVAPAAGANQITVANTTGFTNGDYIRIGTVPEVRRITGIISGNRINLSSNLSFSHSIGAPVQQGEFTVQRRTEATNTYAMCTNSSSGIDKAVYDLMGLAVNPRRSLYDYREGGSVRIADVEINRITAAVDAGTIQAFNGVLYISDTGAFASNIPAQVIRRGIRLINGWALPAGKIDSSTPSLTNDPGLTVVTENPAYILGNYNTGGTSVATSNPPSNTNPISSPVVGTYGRKQAAVIADAITVLSNNWSDSYTASTNRPSRPAASTTINTALVAGIIPSGGGTYSGGAESFIRLLEDWNSTSRSFCYWGSIVQLYASAQANNVWSGAGNIYKEPINSRYFWDPDFGKNPSEGKPYYGSPPGKLQISAYLQQQRWYQVY